MTPYIRLPNIRFERLQDADERGVETTIVLGKTRLKNWEQENIVQLENLNLFYPENLHAKCYCNEMLMVISLMNLYDFSAKNNRQMGIKPTQQEDADLIIYPLRECEFIIESIIKAAEPNIGHKLKFKSIKTSPPLTAKRLRNSPRPLYPMQYGYCP